MSLPSKEDKSCTTSYNGPHNALSQKGGFLLQKACMVTAVTLPDVRDGASGATACMSVTQHIPTNRWPSRWDSSLEHPEGTQYHTPTNVDLSNLPFLSDDSYNTRSRASLVAPPEVVI